MNTEWKNWFNRISTEKEKEIVLGLRVARTETTPEGRQERTFHGIKVQRYRGPDGWSGWMTSDLSTFARWAID